MKKQAEYGFIKDANCSIRTPVTLGRPAQPVYGKGIPILPTVLGKRETRYEQSVYLENLLPLEEYDLIVVLFSGGKDSAACLLRLLEMGVPKEKIELWHHDIDGGGHPVRRMDWPATQAYVRAFSDAMGIKLRTSWRVGGFFGELYRVGASYPIEYEDGAEIKTCRLSPAQIRSEELREQVLQGLDCGDELARLGYRMKFPAKSGDLARRWCSAYLKIMVADSVIRDLDDLRDLGAQKRFPFKGSIANGRWCSPMLKREVGDSVIRHLTDLAALGSPRHKFPAKSSPQQGRYCSGALKAQVQDSLTNNLEKTSRDTKILIVSGERRGESIGRSRYNEIEVHRTNATAKAHRLVHQWRAVIDYSARDIWEIIRRHGVTPHPCYSAGWSRCSCAMCVFSLPKHWAGIRELFPEEYASLRQDEITLNFTLDNKKCLDDYVGDARSCVNHAATKAVKQLVTGEFTVDDIYTPAHEWIFPAGAFGGSEGGPC